MQHINERDPIIVVGGGLSGLATATYLARAGLRVRVVERSRHLGGRAATQVEDGFHFNLGAHALYQRSAAVRVLGELGVPYTGAVPPATAHLIRDGRAAPLAGSLRTLLTTPLLSWRGRLEFMRRYAMLRSLNTIPLDAVPFTTWLTRSIRQPDVRALFAVLGRVVTYANDPDHQSAGATLHQLKLGLGGVLYLDGGWETLVDGLRAAAIKAGVSITTGAGATAVERDQRAWRVCLTDGSSPSASAVVLAVPPDAAATLLADEADGTLRAWLANVEPARAACLDVALRRLPNPAMPYCLGIDQPLYLSVASMTARLAPSGGALIHTLKYLNPHAPSDPRGDEQELEALLDLAQPGWRAEVVHRRFLPRLVASSAVPSAAMGGLSGRPGPRVGGVDGLYIAGDWVGGDGMLADAALASARACAMLVSAEQSRSQGSRGTPVRGVDLAVAG